MDWRRALFFSGFPASAGMTGECAGHPPRSLRFRAPFASRKGHLTRKKPGAVFNPVLLRERSWICASAVKRRRQS